MPGGPVHSSRRSNSWGVGTALVVLAVSFLSLATLSTVAASPTALAVPSGSAAGVAAAAPPPVVTHGDLLVVAGETYTIAPAPGQSTYYQGGNITVDAGGTLYITSVTLSFVEFVASNGTALQRLAHLYHFTDDGQVFVENSTVTTDLQSVNAYAKLNLTVAAGGLFDLSNSTLAFPGWLTVTGTGSNLTVENGSAIHANPVVRNLTEPGILKGDNAFAPTLLVTNGGAASILNSTYTNIYADNFTQNGTPRPAPLAVNHTLLAGGAQVISDLSTPSDSANLSLDWAYPSGITGGEVQFYYSDKNTLPTTVYVNLTYGGTPYVLGTVTLLNGTVNAYANATFPANLTAAINAGGLLQYLNYTGDFGVTPSRISLSLNVQGLPLNATSIAVLLNPPVSNDLTVTGANSRLTAADALFGLTFNRAAASPLSLETPYPWNARELALEDGATAYLANVSATGGITNVFGGYAIHTDATSTAYLYRWAEFNLTGERGILLYNGVASSHYAYNSSQANNATVNNLNNNLSTVSPVLYAYAQAWDRAHDVPSYGASGANGIATVLLASNEITGPSLPNGFFLGNYHITVTVPAIPSPPDRTQSFNWSAISSYPLGVANGTVGYRTPDFGPGVSFPAYNASIDVKSGGIVVTANGTVDSTVKLGQLLGMNVTVTDEGIAPVTSLTVTLLYNAATPKVLAELNRTVDLTAPNQTEVVDLAWLANDTVTGLAGGTFSNGFVVSVVWNHNIAASGGGSLNRTVIVEIQPSDIRVYGGTAPPTSLKASTKYLTAGYVIYNGSGSPTIELEATPGSGTPIVLGTGNPPVNGSRVAQNGSFVIDWSSVGLKAGTSYTLSLVAAYNGVVSPVFKFAGQYEIPAPAPTNPLFLKVLGEPLWLWLAIAVAIVAGAIGFLLFSRQQAAGKLVECGECGNLIPENAKVCPKCGAEFESDVVRCSRCSSTIPAASRFCPECAVQLLGKPGEFGADPERQAYADFTERYRAEAKKDLGENYTDGAFWDWWKRQASYTPFSQWKLQQGQGTSRTGMSAPPAESPPKKGPAAPGGAPPKGRPPAGGKPPAGGSAASPSAAAAGASAPATSAAPPAKPATAAPAPPGAPGALAPCPSCGKEIPPEYLVCPFCGAVTQ